MFTLIAVFENGSETRIVGFTTRQAAERFNDGYEGATRVEIREEV